MNEENKDVVEISKEKYEELLDDQQFLIALRAVGVDNWNGYEHAQDMLEEWNSENVSEGE